MTRCSSPAWEGPSLFYDGTEERNRFTCNGFSDEKGLPGGPTVLE